MSGTAAMSCRAAVSRETEARLNSLVELLGRWNRSVNLVADADPARIRDRHICDSAQIMDYLPPTARQIADLGSGAGFPGLVVAILGAETHPGLTVTLIESDARKCAFLDAAIRETGAPAQTVNARIETVPPLGADIVTARALAPLDTLLGYVSRHLCQGGKALLLKGARYRDEIETARRSWRFDLTIHPSRTSAEGAVLEVGEIARA